MGNAHTIVAYGPTADLCITSLQSQLEYEWEAKLFVERGRVHVPNRDLETPILAQTDTKRFYIHYKEEKRYVEFFRRKSDGPWKAFITL
jgi:hypothetical protein